MGMRQRLAIAAALLGDPEVLILDEPTNGLDPPGIRWVRDLVRAQAKRGRAVLISSHLLSEVAQSVDDVVVIVARHRCGPAARSTTVLGGGDAPVDRVVRTARPPTQLGAPLGRRGLRNRTRRSATRCSSRGAAPRDGRRASPPSTASPSPSCVRHRARSRTPSSRSPEDDA